jgi:nitroreductase
MDAMEAILTRRSIRRYTGEPVTDDEIRQVIKAGAHAPSASNRQPCHYMVIRNPELIQRIAEFHPYAKMAPQAGSCIVVCGDAERQETVGFLVEDCSAAIENMLLAARSMGLGTVWCGLHPVEKLTDAMRSFLSLPDNIIPVGLVVIGHGAEERAVNDRYDEARVHWDKWE